MQFFLIFLCFSLFFSNIKQNIGNLHNIYCLYKMFKIFLRILKGGDSVWFWQGVLLAPQKPYPKLSNWNQICYPKLSSMKKILTRNYPRSFCLVYKIEWNRYFCLNSVRNLFNVTRNLWITMKIQPEICAKMENVDPKSALISQKQDPNLRHVLSVT